MTGTELFVAIRRWLNDEAVATYRWTQAELVDYTNYVLDDIASEIDLFEDYYTAAIVNLALTAGTTSYALDSRTLEVVSATLAGENTNLTPSSTRERQQESHTFPWRYSASVYGTDIALTDNGASADTITSTTTEFLEYGFAPDEFIEIAGSTTTGNNKVVQIDTVTAHTITLISTATLTTVAAGDPILLKQIITGTPTKYMCNYRDGYIALDPTPDAAGMIILETIRKQLTALTVATLGTWTVPIDTNNILNLVDGICWLAYMKSGPSTYNFEKSNFHLKNYEKAKSGMLEDKVQMEGTPRPKSPHPGTI
jgi:hypothetical protein